MIQAFNDQRPMTFDLGLTEEQRVQRRQPFLKIPLKLPTIKQTPAVT